MSPVFPDMADLCPSSRPVCRVPAGLPRCDQLVVTSLHGGGHTAQLRDHLDAGHRRAAGHGMNSTPQVLLYNQLRVDT